MAGATKFAKPEALADLSIVQVQVRAGPPGFHDIPAVPRPCPIAWAANLDEAPAGAVDIWGEVWGLHGDGPTDSHSEAVALARAAATPMQGPARGPTKPTFCSTSTPPS